MIEDWAEDFGVALKCFMTGERAKVYILEELIKRLTVSNEEHVLKDLIMQCSKEAQEKIDSGEFSRPKDWLTSVTNLLGAGESIDRAKILQDEAKVVVLRGCLDDLFLRITMRRATATIQEQLTEVQHLQDKIGAADYIFIGDLEALKGIIRQIAARGMNVSGIRGGVQLLAEEKPVEIAAIKNVRKAILVFGNEAMPKDKELIEAIKEVRDQGKPVVFITDPAVTAEKTIISVLRQIGKEGS